ncbi:MAG: hypothetical protein WC100_01515 [Sterolibacterium sp.]
MVEVSPYRLLGDIIEGLTQAVGASSQLIHAYGNPVGFIMIRDALELSKEGCMKLARENGLLS